MEIWLPLSEAARLLGVTERAVRKRLKRYVVQERHGRGGSSGKTYHVALNSLPAHAQARYWAERAKAAADSTEAPSRPAPGVNLAELEERYGEDVFAEANRRYEAVRAALAPTIMDRTAYIQEVAALHGVDAATLYRWVQAYREGGFEALLPDPKNRPGYGAKSFDPEAVAFIYQQYMRSVKPTVAHVYRKLVEEAERNGWKIGSRATCYRLIDEISHAEKVYFREGEQAWKRTVMPKVRRRPPELANDTWSVDHHQFDLWISYGGRIVRPWLTACRDEHSKIFVGWAISIQPSGDSIALALRHAVLPKKNPALPGRGLPVRLYSDHGDDFESQRVQTALRLLGIEAMQATAYHPWAKPVERSFGIGMVADDFARDQPGYAGRSVQDRPEDAHKKALALHKQGKLHTLQSLSEAFEEWVARYHQRPHSALGMTPLEAYTDGPLARQDTVDARQLDFCLMKGVSRRVYPTGIRMFNREYWAPELEALVGHDVAVRYDPSHVGEIYVFHKDQFLCVATNIELMEFDASEKEVAEVLRRQAQARRRIRERYAERTASLKEVVEASKAAGPDRITTETEEHAASKVRKITGMEKAMRARAGRGATAKTGTVRPAPNELAEEWMLRQAGLK